MMSDESENDVAYENGIERDVYYNKYKLLLEECSQLQRSNEILVYRIQEVNKITKRRFKEAQFFKQRLLNSHDENWSVIPPDVLSEDEDITANKLEQQLVTKDKIKQEKVDDVKDKIEKSKNDSSKIKSTKRPPRKKVPKAERDPNAPKRPSNSFFQFCQEQRQLLMEQITASLKPGEVEPTKQELTKQLALKWNALSLLDKKKYVERYKKSKEKYKAEMEDYKKTK